jgi:probable DNA metabolism protein
MYSNIMDSYQGELFDNELQFDEPQSDAGGGGFSCVPVDISLIAGLYSPEGVDFSALPENAGRLFELSANAIDAIVHARMSELPISAEISRFERKVLNTAQRQAAECVSSDRGDPDVRVVLDAAYKVWHEIDRLRGLLRFSPDEDGVYIARCAPDHFVLPALGPHFRERFGETPWAIIDEKRRLCLYCARGGEPELFYTGEGDIREVRILPRSFTEKEEKTFKTPCSSVVNVLSGQPPADGEWENLWRHYHKIINNESRNNPVLQRRFMPKRYWKYLTEV